METLQVNGVDDITKGRLIEVLRKNICLTGDFGVFRDTMHALAEHFSEPATFSGNAY